MKYFKMVYDQMLNKNQLDNECFQQMLDMLFNLQKMPNGNMMSQLNINLIKDFSEELVNKFRVQIDIGQQIGQMGQINDDLKVSNHVLVIYVRFIISTYANLKANAQAAIYQSEIVEKLMIIYFEVYNNCIQKRCNGTLVKLLQNNISALFQSQHYEANQI